MYYAVFLLGLILTISLKRSRKAFNLYFVIVLLLAVFRYAVGPDYFSYAILYDRLAPTFQQVFTQQANQEFLFRLFGVVFKASGANYDVYVIIITMINMIFVYKTCSNYSDFPIMSLFAYYSFFYFVWTFSVYRQSLTLSIGVYYLIKCLKENKFKKIVLISIVLALIHASALLIIVFYLLAKINYKRKTLVIMSVVSGAISFIPIGKIAVSISDIGIIDRMKPYISSDNSLGSILDFKSISRIVFLLLGLIFYNALIEHGIVHKYIIKIFILSMFSYFVFKFSELTASRISIYGFYLLILVLPNAYSLYKVKFDKLLFTMLFVILSSLFFLKEIATMKDLSGIVNDDWKVPYTSVFNRTATEIDHKFYIILHDEGKVP